MDNQFRATRFSDHFDKALLLHDIKGLHDDTAMTIVRHTEKLLQQKFFFFQGTTEKDGKETPKMVIGPFYSQTRTTHERDGAAQPKTALRLFTIVGSAYQQGFARFHEIEAWGTLSDFAAPVDLLDKRCLEQQCLYHSYPKFVEQKDDADHILRLTASTRHRSYARARTRCFLPRTKIKEVLFRTITESFQTLAPQTGNNWRPVLSHLDELTNAFQGDLLFAFRDVYERFMMHLDRDALNFMHEHDEFTWGKGGHGNEKHGAYGIIHKAPNPLVREWRKQALALMAQLGLTQVFVQKSFEGGDIDPAWVAIDSGTAPITVLKETFPEHKDIWRKVLQAGTRIPRHIGLELLSSSAYSSTHPYGMRAKELFKLSVPRTVEDWRIFHRTMNWLYGYTTKGLFSNEGIRGDLPASSCAEVSIARRTWQSTKGLRSWTDFYASLPGNTRERISTRHFYAQLSNCRDMIDSMSRHILSPCLFRTRPLSAQWRDQPEDSLKLAFRLCLLETMNIRHLLRGSDYWHSERVNFSGRIAALGFRPDKTEYHNWLPLVENVTAPNGVRFVALVTKEALQEETDVMKHCVWSYTGNCISKTSHIFSLQDADGTRLATVEYKERPYGDGQIEIYRNHIEAHKYHPVPTQADQASRWLVSQIANGFLNPDFAAIHQRRLHLKKASSQIRTDFDYGDPALCEQVYQLYKPCLPTKIESKAPCVADFLCVIGMEPHLKKYHVELPPRPASVRHVPSRCLSQTTGQQNG